VRLSHFIKEPAAAAATLNGRYAFYFYYCKWKIPVFKPTEKFEWR